MAQNFKQSLGQSVGCLAYEGIRERTFTWNIPEIWLREKSCNHRLCRGDY